MVLKSLILKNFRAYKDIQINFDENMNVFIGQNDIGKSYNFRGFRYFGSKSY